MFQENAADPSPIDLAHEPGHQLIKNVELKSSGLL